MNKYIQTYMYVYYVFYSEFFLKYLASMRFVIYKIYRS